MEAACHVSKSSIPTGTSLQNSDHWDRVTVNLYDPKHNAVDSDGNVYITDRKNNDIQEFKPEN